MSNINEFTKSDECPDTALTLAAVSMLGGEKAWNEMREDLSDGHGVDPLSIEHWNTAKNLRAFYDAGVARMIRKIVPSDVYMSVISANTGISVERLEQLIGDAQAQPKDEELQPLTDWTLSWLASGYENYLG